MIAIPQAGEPVNIISQIHNGFRINIELPIIRVDGYDIETKRFKIAIETFNINKSTELVFIEQLGSSWILSPDRTR